MNLRRCNDCRCFLDSSCQALICGVCAAVELKCVSCCETKSRNCLISVAQSFWCVDCYRKELNLPPEKSPGAKHDSGKLQYTLIDPFAKAWLAGVLTYGATRYSPDGWKSVEDAERRYRNAFERHWNDYLSGAETDTDSGLPSLAMCLCNIMFLVALKCPKDLVEVQRRTTEAIRKWKEKK